MMWIKLSKINRNPNIPMKFSFGILQLGLGFLVTYLGYQFAQNSLVPLLTLVFLYMLHTTGELFLSPIGLSMVTKLSPKKMAGTAMGAWFLSFAIANFLGGKIAAMTGSEHGGIKTDKTVFNLETTVEEAFEMNKKTADFEKWQVLAKDVPKGYEVAKNISYQKYMDIEDWVLLRENLVKDASMDTWLQKRDSIDTIKSAEDWLVRENWDDLGVRYKAMAQLDEKANMTPGTSKNEWLYFIGNLDTSSFAKDSLANEKWNDIKSSCKLVQKARDNGNVSLEDWLYFRGDFETLTHADTLLLADGLTQQKSIVQSARLDKYIDIFTKIGLILLAFSVIIALFSNPLKKLMHGVK
jgi:hypothetical protein